MPHIHTEPNQHDHTVSAYIIRLDGAEPLALVHMHKKLGRLLAIGGHIELDETIWSSITHEIREESGYELVQLDVMQPALRIAPASVTDAVVHPQPFIMNTHAFSSTHFHSDTCYLFVTHELPRFLPDKDESSDLRWLTRSELGLLTSQEMPDNSRIIYLQAMDSFLENWAPIPAADFRTDKILFT